MIRSLLLWIVFWIVTPLIVVLAIIGLLVAGPNMSHRVHLFWCRISIKIYGIDLDITGSENVNKSSPIIYIANHRSLLDIFVVGSVLGAQYRWLAKASLFKIPIFGWGMRATGYIPVDRSTSSKSKQSLFKAADRVKKGSSLIIFPEGTRAKTNTLNKFKSGAFTIAKRANVPIQVVIIDGTEKLMQKNEKHLIQRIKPGLVKVKVLPLIQPEAYSELNADELKEWVREKFVGETS